MINSMRKTVRVNGTSCSFLSPKSTTRIPYPPWFVRAKLMILRRSWVVRRSYRYSVETDDLLHGEVRSIRLGQDGGSYR